MTPPSGHEQQPILITGGAQGIGRTIVAQALAAGKPVVAFDVDAEANDELVRAHPGRPLEVITGDVSIEGDVRSAVAAAEDLFGGLGAVVNNAGIGIGKPVETLDLEEWNRVIGVNLTGAFLTAKHAAAALRRAQGAIVNIASTRASMSEPDTEAYAASKGGIVALTHALAISLGPDIRVNAVSPGWIEVRDRKKRAEREEPELREIDHRQHPAGRVGRPEDVARLVLWLLSEDAGFVTGQNWTIDGGMTRKMIYEH